MPQDTPRLDGRMPGAAPTAAETSTSSGEGTAASLPAHHSSASPGMIWSVGIVAALACAGGFYYLRTAAHRAWQRYATEINGEFSERNAYSPAYVSGSLLDRALFMEASTNNDDDAPYYHTRVSMPVTNPGMLIMGLRRKSLLEEAQTRNDKPAFVFGDSEFDRRFHLVANNDDALPVVLDSELRRQLMQYNDIEIYIRPNVVEWRRAGEVSDLQAIRKLNRALARAAAAIDALPRRSLSLSQRMSYEDIIRKGI